MVRRVLMGLLQAWNHGFHVCLFPSPLHAYVHMYYVGALRWIEKSRFVALSLRSLFRDFGDCGTENSVCLCVWINSAENSATAEQRILSVCLSVRVLCPTLLHPNKSGDNTF